MIFSNDNYVLFSLLSLSQFHQKLKYTYVMTMREYFFVRADLQD